MKPIINIISFLLIGTACTGQQDKNLKLCNVDSKYANKVDSVLKLMTLEEKIGQLNQYTGNAQATGPEVIDNTKHEQIKSGRVGSMLNVIGAATTREIQSFALQSRLGIPLLFGQDVIHGYRTVYPIPLGEAASFDLDLMERTARGAAIEASSEGIHWTFAPMVDITRDARWGRVMEGAGEDTWYGTKVGIARIKGFQGNDLADSNTILACAKHFAAYGACIAGKDYNTVDISDMTLHEVYLPPFKAAAQAGVATFMNSFNDINGIPATAHTGIQRDMLKGMWDFNGFTVSDWGSIREMVDHGYAADLKESANQAIIAGSDMDMESRAYVSHLRELVESGEVPITYVDDAVRRILLKKFQLGLFDDPYKYCNEENEKETVLSQPLRYLARESGKKSIVLLRNENKALPLKDDVKRIAVIGALADSKQDMLGFWASEGIAEEAVTLLQGLKNRYPDAKIDYVEGYDLNTNQLTSSAQARKIALAADVVILAVGERANESGEAKSLADININANQQQLVNDLKPYSKRLVTVIMGGRPMIFNELTGASDAILLTWWLGTEAGNAMADVISGDYNPSGKLPMTFPRHIGQIPIYYNYKSTGRPESKYSSYSCRYLDVDFEPAYCFGFGKSYTEFEISEPRVIGNNHSFDKPVEIEVTVKNTGIYKGKETVQLYIRDKVASVTRPIKEFKGFQQVELLPCEEKTVRFILQKEDFYFYNKDLDFISEPGEFDIRVGKSATELNPVTIYISESERN